MARIMGPLWVMGWVAYYRGYRHKNGLPNLRNTKHDWDAEQLEIFADTGEWELLEQFKIEVERKKRANNHSSKPAAP